MSKFVACTNHFVSRKMRYMEDLGQRDSNSTQRYQAIDKGIKKEGGHLDLKSAADILSDNSSGVCSHRLEIGMGTLWSFVADLRERTFMIAEGHPCTSRYVVDSRLRRFANRFQSRF
jgi:hypothetical protein